LESAGIGIGASVAFAADRESQAGQETGKQGERPLFISLFSLCYLPLGEII